MNEELLLCKARWKCIQNVWNESKKFDLKFWLADEVKNEYLFN